MMFYNDCCNVIISAKGRCQYPVYLMSKMHFKGKNNAK